MGRLKHRGKKKRLISKSKIDSAPLWTSLKKYGIKRTRTRRIQVNQRSHWRRDSKVKA